MTRSFFTFFKPLKAFFFLSFFLFFQAEAFFESSNTLSSQKEEGKNFKAIKVEIYHSLTRKKVEVSEFLKVLSSYEVVLLGERHDQKNHHDFRAFLIEQIKTKNKGQVKSVSFEHIQKKDQPLLDEFEKKRGEKAFHYVDELAQLLDWEKSWGDWPLFRSLFETTYKVSKKVLGLNFSFEKMKQIVKEGREALDGEFIKKTALDQKLPPQGQLRLKEDIIEGHCGKLPPSVVEAFYFAQRARDAFMTDTLLSSLSKKDLAFVMAGNSHVRKDYGMPWYFSKRGYESVVSVKMDFLTKEGLPFWDKRDEGAYDYVVFFPFQELENPCPSF